MGGIHANSAYPADFLRDNLQIQTNVIDAAWRSGVTKLLFLGSSCIYPKFAPQPIREDCTANGSAGTHERVVRDRKDRRHQDVPGLSSPIRLQRHFSMPTNLYGPGDNFDLTNSHVLPALIRRFHEAKLRGDDEVVVWGSGSPRREFLHCDDLANAVVFLMKTYESEELINIGCGQDVSIRELADLVANVVGFSGRLTFDSTKPDGTPRKLLDIGRLAGLGWAPEIPLEKGISETYRWFAASQGLVRR